VYENHENFQALPTLGITFAFEVLAQLISDAPGLNFNPMMLLHGEQNLEIRSPIPTSGSITSTAKVSGVYDKGKGVTLVLDATSRDEKGQEICFNQFTVFIRGIGGYGGDRGPAPEDLSPPNRKPDAIYLDKTTANQALIYRLASGDMNPLHADPAMAAMGRFDQPILHGMCSYGFAARAVIKTYCQNQAKLFKGIKARMTKHVFPGETLETQMWKVGPGRVVFQVRAVERDVIVLGNASAMFIEALESACPLPSKNPAFESDALFQTLQMKVAEQGASLVEKVQGTFHFKLTDGPSGASKSWTIDLSSGNGSIISSAPSKADCTITLSDTDCVALFSGKLNPVRHLLSPS
jgi:acyl dehydratase